MRWGAYKAWSRSLPVRMFWALAFGVSAFLTMGSLRVAVVLTAFVAVGGCLAWIVDGSRRARQSGASS